MATRMDRKKKFMNNMMDTTRNIFQKTEKAPIEEILSARSTKLRTNVFAVRLFALFALWLKSAKKPNCANYQQCEQFISCNKVEVDDSKAGKWTVAKLDGLLKVDGPGMK